MLEALKISELHHKTRKMVEENQKLAVEQALKERIEKTEATQSDIAMGVTNVTLEPFSTALVSQMINGKRSGISSRKWMVMGRFLEVPGFESGDWQLFETPSFRSINKALTMAKSHGEIYAIYGDTGHGKTTACRMFVQKNPRNSFLVTVRKHDTVKDLAANIAKTMKINHEGKLAHLIDRICERLNMLSQPLLILDDVGKGIGKINALIQTIIDSTELGFNKRSAGIVMLGTLEFERDFQRQIINGRSFAPELNGRINHWGKVKGPTRKVVTSICTTYGIKDSACQAFILNHIKDYRDIRSIVIKALRIAKGEEVTLGMIESITKHSK